ncbi:hypothetical protein BDR26DRAFT_920369 [Obelidium mucronatum]|nr:hypothetical protein BDR26DRAFT_920369 [Obelidium mucronatum]
MKTLLLLLAASVLAAPVAEPTPASDAATAALAAAPACLTQCLITLGAQHAPKPLAGIPEVCYLIGGTTGRSVGFVATCLQTACGAAELPRAAAALLDAAFAKGVASACFGVSEEQLAARVYDAARPVDGEKYHLFGNTVAILAAYGMLANTPPCFASCLVSDALLDKSSLASICMHVNNMSEGAGEGDGLCVEKGCAEDQIAAGNKWFKSNAAAFGEQCSTILSAFRV